MTFSITTICHYAQCRCAECRDLFIVNLNVILPSVVTLSVVTLSVVTLSVVRLSVVAPKLRPQKVLYDWERPITAAWSTSRTLGTSTATPRMASCRSSSPTRPTRCIPNRRRRYNFCPTTTRRSRRSSPPKPRRCRCRQTFTFLFVSESVGEQARVFVLG